jgi:hypothetical protein
VIHRRGEDGSAALLFLGFNQAPMTVTLDGPEGTWALTLDASAQEFAGSGDSPMPKSLLLSWQGAPVSLPAHAAVVYVQEKAVHG